MSRIPTRTNPVRRAGAWLWQACEDHPALPLAVVAVALVLVNSTWLN